MIVAFCFYIFIIVCIIVATLVVIGLGVLLFFLIKSMIEEVLEEKKE